MRKLFWTIAAGVLLSAPAWAETIELVTYYPSSSNQGDLHARSLTVGTAYQNVDAADGAALIADQMGIGTSTPAGVLDVVGVPNQADKVLFMPGAGGALNVGIGTTAPQTTSPSNNLSTGNLDANDLYLRSAGHWVSQSLNFNRVVKTDGDFSTASTSFVTVPGTSVTISTGTNQRVLVTLIVVANNNGAGSFLHLGLSIDGAWVEGGASLAVYGWYNDASTSFSYVSAPLSTGSHTVALGLRSGSGIAYGSMVSGGNNVTLRISNSTPLILSVVTL